MSKPAFGWEMRGSQNAEGDLLGNQLKLVELTPGETATVTVKPARGIDLGAGPGNPVAHEVTGGSVGLILDARGRPIALPESRDEARDVVKGWYRELNIIDEGCVMGQAYAPDSKSPRTRCSQLPRPSPCGAK